MARDPNERVGPGQDLEKADDFKALGIAVPSGFVIGTQTGQYYAHYNVHADGHTTVEWYKRGAGGGPGKPDPIELVTPGVPAKDIKDEWDKGNAKAANVYIGTNPTTGKPTQVTESPDGTKTYDDTQVPASALPPTPAQQNEAALNAQRAKNAAWPADQDPRYETDEDRAKRADARIKEQGAAAAKAEADAKAEREKRAPQVVPATINTTSPRMGILVTGPDGAQTVQWVPNENYQKPDPKPITIPGNPRTIYWAEADGTIRAEKNKDYVKPSKIIPHPADPRRMINVTEDDDGNPVILPVDDKTAIKPADLPILQSKYGEIASSLGRLAQELNQRVARQEMTPQERTEAFTAAYKQAETQVSEINSILENSKAIWSGQVQQRGQSLSETQSRRSFASDAAGRAITTGYNIATSAGPGHGKQIAAGVEALMGMQERYAQGMGGFRESPEIGLPPALEQARGIGLPGYPMPGGGGGGGPAPSVPPPGAPSVGTNAIGVGAIGEVPAPGGQPPVPAGRPAPLLPPPPPVTGPMGAGPDVSGMGSALQGAQAYAGAPVAAGGDGMWDPTQTMQGMLGQGGDAAWEEAVRRAAGSFGRFGG